VLKRPIRANGAVFGGAAYRFDRLACKREGWPLRLSAKCPQTARLGRGPSLNIQDVR